jgi:hypothetical protein
MTELIAAIPFELPHRHARGFWKKMERARREEAQSLVELALLMPLFLVILLGSAEFARFAWAAVLTSNAARAGAAFGAVSPTNAINGTGIATAAANDSTNLSGLNTTSSVSCYCIYGNNTAGSCAPSGAASLQAFCGASPIVDYITVNTMSTVTVFGRQFTANGQATMVIAQ